MNAPAQIHTAFTWHRTPEARALLACLDRGALKYRPHPLEPGVSNFCGEGDWVGNGKACFGCGECAACRNDDFIDQIAGLRRNAIEQEAGVFVGPETTADQMNVFLEVSRRVPKLSEVIAKHSGRSWMECA